MMHFLNRWLFSTNHKDIGTLYLIFSMGAGVLLPIIMLYYTVVIFIYEIFKQKITLNIYEFFLIELIFFIILFFFLHFFFTFSRNYYLIRFIFITFFLSVFNFYFFIDFLFLHVLLLHMLFLFSYLFYLKLKTEFQLFLEQNIIAEAVSRYNTEYLQKLVSEINLNHIDSTCVLDDNAITSLNKKYSGQHLIVLYYAIQSYLLLFLFTLIDYLIIKSNFIFNFIKKVLKIWYSFAYIFSDYLRSDGIDNNKLIIQIIITFFIGVYYITFRNILLNYSNLNFYEANYFPFFIYVIIFLFPLKFYPLYCLALDTYVSVKDELTFKNFIYLFSNLGRGKDQLKNVTSYQLIRKVGTVAAILKSPSANTLIFGTISIAAGTLIASSVQEIGVTQRHAQDRMDRLAQYEQDRMDRLAQYEQDRVDRLAKEARDEQYRREKLQLQQKQSRSWRLW